MRKVSRQYVNISKNGNGIFFKLEIMFFEFRLLLENHKKLLNFRKSVIKDNGLKIFRKNE